MSIRCRLPTLPHNQSPFGLAKHPGCAHRPEHSLWCGGDTTQSIIGRLGIRAGDNRPGRSIPMFGQRLLDAALEKLAGRPDVAARCSDNADQDLVACIIERWCREYT